MNPKFDGDDESLLSSFWEYVSPTSNTNELFASGIRASRSTSNNDAHNDVANERTGLLDSNRTKNLRSTTTSSTFAGSNNDVIYESPQLVQNSLDQLERELRIIEINYPGSAVAYHKACQQSYEYVQSLRISFLRAECFNVSKASLRMTSFWEEKEQLFGGGGKGGFSSSLSDNNSNNSILGRPIRLSDLDVDDLTALRSGALQLLMPQQQQPQQHQNQSTNSNNHSMKSTATLDSHNRGVLCYFPKYDVSKTPDDMTRAWWYYVQCLLFDDDNYGDDSNNKNNNNFRGGGEGVHHQRHGFVVITYHVGDVGLSEMDRSMNLNCQGLNSLKQLPIRFSGKIHYCFNDYKIRQALNLYKIYATTGRSYWYSSGDGGGSGGANNNEDDSNEDEEESWYLHDGECLFIL
jgi:hypothetical protein